MTLYLAEHFEKQRRALGLRPGQLAALIGCPNPIKAGHRIRQFELYGVVNRELFDKLAAALKIDDKTIENLIEQDRKAQYKAWLKWVKTPIQPYLVDRLMPAVYRTIPVPKGFKKRKHAELWAARIARESRRQCCLVWSRRLSIWFNREGDVVGRTTATPDKLNTPWVQLGRRKVTFSKDLRSAIPVDSPKQRCNSLRDRRR